MTKLNPEFVKQIFSKIPELEQIIMKLKLLGKDKPIYTDWVILIILINTCSDDGEVMGRIARILHKANLQLDFFEKQKV